MNKSDWQRRAALFDEAVDLPAADRESWLAGLAQREPAHAEAVAKMLADYGRESSGERQAGTESLSLIGVPARSFEAQLEAATAGELKLQPGEEISSWRLERKIGEGGMGAVWLAARDDGHYEGHAAIKFLRAGLGKTEIVARFLRERRLLARLAHPNIARLLDAGTYQGEPYLVMEFIEGEFITAWAASRAKDVEARVALMLKVCRAVEHAHGQLIVHRDLKPSNVLVDSRGEPYLLDFGIAKLIDDEDEESGTALTRMTGRGFTLGYCAPEQITGDATGVAADVYSLGVLLFELLSGSLPFKPARDGRTALEHAIVHTDARTLGRALDTPDEAAAKNRPHDVAHARGDLEAIVGKALRRIPADRYATVGALAADLAAWLAHSPISIRAEDRRYRARLWMTRNWPMASLGAVALVAILAGLGFSLWQRSEALAAAQRAQEEAVRANKVADYLGELIQSASPDSHGGKWPTVLALLEQSEKDLDKQFADDPKTHALLLKKLVDTNDALNRDSVALAQLAQLTELLARTDGADSEAAWDAQKQRAQLLRRTSLYREAFEIDEALLPKFAARYGKQSEEYGRLLMGTTDNLSGTGRMQEARQRLVEGAAILTRLFPNDLAKRIDLVNDSAVLFTRQGMWREAMQTLATIEGDLPAMAKLGGQSVRDSLIMRRNLEAIRIRVGSYDGVEARLRQLIVENDGLLGKDNLHSGLALDNLRSLMCETGRFAECMSIGRELVDLRKRQVGGSAADILDAELNLLVLELRLGRHTGADALGPLERLLAAIPKTITDAGTVRSELYRVLADGAVNAGALTLAEHAQQLARADLARVNNANPERVAQVDRSAALVAYVRGDAKGAAALLTPRFRAYETSGEGNTPRRAVLWLQRALYEIEFDPEAAARSLAQSRDIFKGAGSAQPHIAVLLDYVDARLRASGNAREETNAFALRAAEDAVDKTWLRKRPASGPWRPPLLASV